jgi:hypothetical protein
MYFVNVVGLMDGVSACCAGCSHNTIVLHGDFDGVIVHTALLSFTATLTGLSYALSTTLTLEMFKLHRWQYRQTS